ncbi:hypothetical protein B9037_016835 [Klebsiella aerogenes]|nr:hypothetical protein B9037_016835 [Klebsiella aerogenes]
MSYLALNSATAGEKGELYSPRLLTKKEKAWFFLLCGYQPKTNKLIFLVICLLQSVSPTVA